MSQFSEDNKVDLEESPSADKAGSPDTDKIESALTELDSEVVKNIETLLSKIEIIDELCTRIDKLESKQAGMESSLNQQTRDTSKNTSARKRSDGDVETDNGAKVRTFKFAGEMDDEIDDNSQDDLLENDLEDEAEDSSAGYKFVFGCFYCNETVNEFDTFCPYCGEQLEEQPTGTDWLEQVGKHDDQFQPSDDWEEDYDDEQHDTYDEEYDPSVRRHMRDYHEDRGYDRLRDTGYSRRGPSDLERPLCHICGGDTQYIPRYDRWYCYRCAEYAISSDSRQNIGLENSQKDRTRVLDRIMAHRHSETKTVSKTDDKPLMHYGPYTSPEVITRISLIDSEKTQNKKKLFTKR
jgi:hypothetical protein